MNIYLKRWCDPVLPNDGIRILICRYRPRGLLKKNETWHLWLTQLAPSRKLHARFYGKKGYKLIDWKKYIDCYIKEMKTTGSKNLIILLAHLLRFDVTITLLCSSACIDENQCHRMILKTLIMEELSHLDQ